MRLYLYIGAVLALLAGLWGAYHTVYTRGWDARDSIAQAQALSNRASVADAKAAAILAGVADAKERDKKTIAELTRQYNSSEIMVALLDATLKLQEITPYIQEKPNASKPQPPPLLGQSVLDDGTVRMLNNARAGFPDPGSSAAGRGHEASGAFTATPPYVTGGELARNDLEVVRLYHILATRHNDLVDWVEKQCSATGTNP